MNRSLQTYRGGKSGVVAYATGPDFIIVQFRSGERYLYNHTAPGRKHVEAMKQKAASHQGLATYISQRVKNNYAEKLDHSAGIMQLKVE